MVARIQEFVSDYERRLRETGFAPRLSYGRPMLSEDGGPNAMFFTCLFWEEATALQFMKDIGLIRSTELCTTCGGEMRWTPDTRIRDRYPWRCRKANAGIKCNESRSIRHGSWFQHSNLTFVEILLITYGIVCREPALRIQQEYRLSAHTVADWGMFCRETMLVFMESSSVKIGGPQKIVEIDESKFGRRKYHRGHPVRGQWVFGGVERGSGRTFLVPVRDRTADTLMAVIRDWIEPGTTVISDCWGSYRDLSTQGYTHRTVNHSFNFVDPNTGAHTNTIEATWRVVKVFLGQYNRGEDYHYHLAHYMFAARCRAQGVPPFIQFLHLVANTDWSRCDGPR